MNSTSTNDPSLTMPPLYLELKDAGFQLKLFAPALLYAVLASVGIPLNFSVCYITLKSEYRTLGSPTGILIAMNSFFELLHQSGHFCFLVVTASGTNFIPAREAFRWERLAFFGFIATTNCFSLSVDRLFAVASPIRYRNMPKRFYIFLHLIFICVYVAVPIYYEFLAVQQTPEWPITGFISEMHTIPNNQFTHGMLISAIFNCLTILCYLLVFLLVKCRRKEASLRSTNNDSLRRLYRSLALIVGINVGSYLLGCLMHLILFNLIDITGWTASDIWLFMALTGFSVNICAIANAPILLTNSSEYSAAYRREQWLFFKICCPKRIAAADVKNINQPVAGTIQVLPVAIASTLEMLKTKCTPFHPPCRCSVQKMGLHTYLCISIPTKINSKTVQRENVQPSGM